MYYSVFFTLVELLISFGSLALPIGIGVCLLLRGWMFHVLIYLNL